MERVEAIREWCVHEAGNFIDNRKRSTIIGYQESNDLNTIDELIRVAREIEKYITGS